MHCLFPRWMMPMGHLMDRDLNLVVPKAKESDTPMGM